MRLKPHIHHSFIVVPRWQDLDPGLWVGGHPGNPGPAEHQPNIFYRGCYLWRCGVVTSSTIKIQSPFWSGSSFVFFFFAKAKDTKRDSSFPFGFKTPHKMVHRSQVPAPASVPPPPWRRRLGNLMPKPSREGGREMNEPPRTSFKKRRCG